MCSSPCLSPPSVFLSSLSTHAFDIHLKYRLDSVITFTVNQDIATFSSSQASPASCRAPTAPEICSLHLFFYIRDADVTSLRHKPSPIYFKTISSILPSLLSASTIPKDGITFEIRSDFASSFTSRKKLSSEAGLYTVLMQKDLPPVTAL